MTDLPRIRKQTNPEPWLYTAILVGYPKPGVGLLVDLYHRIDRTGWECLPHIDTEAGR